MIACAITAAHTVAQLKQLIQHWDAISLKTQVCLHNCTKTGSHENINENIKITFQFTFICQITTKTTCSTHIFFIFTFSKHDYHVEFLKNMKRQKRTGNEIRLSAFNACILMYYIYYDIMFKKLFMLYFECRAHAVEEFSSCVYESMCVGRIPGKQVKSGTNLAFLIKEIRRDQKVFIGCLERPFYE